MRKCCASVCLLVLLSFLIRPAGAITVGQVDNFQDLTVAGWTMGLNSPQLPFTVSSGGPMGANDAFVEAISTGTTGANSKMIVFNANQWTGNYVAVGVTQITAEMANFGPSPLFMRVAIQDNFGSEYGSTVAFPLPADGQWHPVSFNLSASGMSLIQGGSSFTTAMSNVGVLRILSAANAPTFMGDTVQATLGIDEITALPEPAAMGVVLLMGGVLPRRRWVAHGNASKCG